MLEPSTTSFVRAYCYLTAFTTHASAYAPIINFGGSQACGAGVNKNGVLAPIAVGGGSAPAAVGTGTAQLSLNQWYRVEVKIIRNGSNQATEITVLLDGTQIGTWTGTGTADTSLTQLFLGDDWAIGGMTIYYDDVAVNNSAGSDQNTYPGDGSVYYLRPDSDPGTSSANWTKPGGSTSNRNTSTDDAPPVFAADSTSSANAEKFLRNPTSAANAALNITLTDYTTAGVTGTITVIQPVAVTAVAASTSPPSGDLGLASNPTIAQLSIGTFGSSAASATATTWNRKTGTVTYNPTVTAGTGPVIQVRKVTATTRVAMVNALALIVEAQPASGDTESTTVDDATSVTDALGKAPVKAASDTAATTDALAKTSAKAIADPAASTDARAKTVGKAVADSAASTDSQAKTAGKTVGDTAAATDQPTPTTAFVRTISDTAAATDAAANTITHPLADSAAATDAISNAPAPTVADTATATDATSRTTGKALTETPATTDAVSNAAAHPVADTATATDSTVHAWDAVRAVSDTADATDTIDTGGNAAHTKSINDTAAATDAVAKTATHPLTEAPTATDATAKTATHPVSDTAASTDTTAKTVAHPVADSSTANDTVSKTAAATIADATTAADDTVKAVGSAQTETADTTDAATTEAQIARLLEDLLEATDANQIDWSGATPTRWPLNPTGTRWEQATSTRWPLTPDNEHWDQTPSDRWSPAPQTTRW